MPSCRSEASTPPLPPAPARCRPVSFRTPGGTPRTRPRPRFRLMKTFLSLLLLTLLWALLYLTGLGRREIRGEEWRRTLPGRTMLNTGQWLVPYSGGQPFVRKPPFINWMSAASFKVTGVQNEWSARLPSAITMLGASLLMFAFTRRALGHETALLGTVCFLTIIGSIEKGRLAEIEVYYIAFTGAAFAAWLAGFMGGVNRWLSWLVTGLLLGLGLLAKGPAHLMFFYFLVLGICWRTRRWREFFSLPHLAGALVCLGVALAWAIPFIAAFEKLPRETNEGAIAAWMREVSSRVTGEEETSLQDWLVRGPRALMMFLPWVLLLPLVFRRAPVEQALADPEKSRVFRGLLFGAAAGFAVMVLLPSSSPRYVAPLFGPGTLLLGWALAAGLADPWVKCLKAWKWLVLAILAIAFLAMGWLLFFSKENPHLAWSGIFLWIAGFLTAAIVCAWVITYRWTQARALAAWTALASIAAVACYGAFTSVYVHTDRIIKSTAETISNAMEPRDGPLYIVHLGQIPYPFYLPEDSIEVHDIENVPSQGVKWMLTTPEIYEDSPGRPGWRRYFETRHGPSEVRAEAVGAWGEEDKRNQKYILIRFAGKGA